MSFTSRYYHAYIFMMGVFFMISCQNNPKNADEAGAKSSGKLQEGRWRAVFQLDEEPEPDPSMRLELPFNFDLSRTDKGGYAMHLINADERISTDEINFVSEDSVIIKMPYFNSEIRAKINDRRMMGAWYNFDKGADYFLPLYAVFGDSARFHVPTTDSIINVAGTWEVTFIADDKSGKTDAIGEFKQKGNQVTGTFITPTGDYRYLEGIATDHEVMLSCFDGSHAFLFKAGINDAGDLNGDAWYGKHAREIWLAYKNDAPTLPMEGQLSEMKADKFDFAFPDLTGKKVSSSDEQFNNKVVLVQIMGSWCPNCLDETRLLVELHNKYHDKGLEIVALAFERSPDMAVSRPILERYVRQTGIKYPVLLAGSADKKAASAALPQLNALKAYPTTLLIDRNKKVTGIYTGISGPATSEYKKFVADFEAAIAQLLQQSES
jgi:thiol-disulfide isomerase/thioredoxin